MASPIGSPARFGGICQIALTVDDLEKAVSFYRDILGLSFLFSAPPGLAFFDVGGVRLMLTLPEGQAGGTNSVIYYRVGDIGLAFAELGARGVVFVDTPHLVARMPDHELWMVFLKDPSGNLAGLMEERPEELA